MLFCDTAMYFQTLFHMFISLHRKSTQFNKEAYVDFAAAQIKTLSFLAYIVRIFQVRVNFLVKLSLLSQVVFMYIHVLNIHSKEPSKYPKSTDQISGDTWSVDETCCNRFSGSSVENILLS